ncbi:MAG: aldehyde dehydrogenase family protein [Gammaproteobacteria bacterium]|nr:aldehyde dehydrogenase family protein [Gammaproteobacteria bacterium]
MGERTIPARNPRTGVVDYEFQAASSADVEREVAAMREHQPAWEALGIERRSSVLRRWADAVEEHSEALLEALVADTGRYSLSRGEVLGVRRRIEAWCAQAPGLMAVEERVSRVNSDVVLANQYVPFCAVGVISPWNFPLTLSLIDGLPALFAGCSVALKPSEVTPRFIGPLKESIRAVPELARVFRVLPGDGETGAALVKHVDLVCFTGSVATGRKVAAAAGERFIPAYLELGGKDPAMVLEGADLERAADAVVRQAVINSGQVCLSLERIYVQKGVFDEFLDLLVARAEKVRLNYPDMHSGHIGPLISGDQAAIIEEHLADAVARGATIHCGGKIENHGGGDWCAATVLSDVDHGMKIMTEETFGPIIPVMKFSDVDEGVALSNDSDYGLSAAVFAETDEKALDIARRINCGGMSINDAGLQSVTTECEKQSFNYSGLGASRMGPSGLLRFFRKKALMTQKGYPRTIDELGEV